jgi:Fe-S-cluster-containing hydrogenase component 2
LENAVPRHNLNKTIELKVVVDKKRCTGCRSCALISPDAGIEIEVEDD